MKSASTVVGDNIQKFIETGEFEKARILMPSFNELLQQDIVEHQELLKRLEDTETWIDEQKARPGSKDPSRSALHAHLDQILDFNNAAAIDEKLVPAQIHKFFRSLHK